MSLEVQVVGLFVSALVPQLIQFEMLLAPLMQALRPSDELLPLVGMDAADIFLQRHTVLGQDRAILVGDAVLGNLIQHHVVVAHVQGHADHLVEF